MSNWTMLEVQALEEKNGGGNRAAIRQWLAGVPESVRPGPDSHIDVKKAFITRAYDKREWFGSASSETSIATAASTPAKVAPTQQSKQETLQKQPQVEKPASSNRNQVASVNLLDDDSFGAQPPVSGSTQTSNAVVHGSCNLLDDSFFSSPAPASNVAVSSAPSLVQDSSLGGFDPLLGGGIVQNNVAPSSGSAFSFIAQSSQPVSSNQSGFGVAVTATSAPNEANQPTLGQTSESSAFSFIAASQSSQPSSQVPFDPLGSAGPAFLQQPQPAPQLGSFASGYGTTAGFFPQQPMWATGGYTQCQMNQCMTPWGGVHGHQHSMPSGPVGMPMNLGGPQLCAGNPSPVGGNTGLVTTATQPSKPQSQSNQASSFDPFDPFAPGPISVCA